MTRSNDWSPTQRIALFGGTFDPIHIGHLAVAAAAARRFRLERVYFIPAAHPPHKSPAELTPFAHRYAMVALACANRPRFVPSLAESDPKRISYTIDTVEHFRQQMGPPTHRVLLLMGADAFLQIQSWKRWRDLLGSCDFIVAYRPGFPLERIASVIPTELLHSTHARSASRIPLRGGTIHLLATVASPVSATEIRQRCRAGRSLRGLVPPAVADYIVKQALYR